MNKFLAIPAPARSFGLAGLLPFFFSALVCWASPTIYFFGMSGAFILCAYGAVILSFLGGIRWGVAMQHTRMIQDWRVVGLAMVPSLLGWTALMLPPLVGLALLALGFIFQIIIDYRASEAGITPPWFLSLRIVLTLGAILSIAVGGLGLLST